MNNESDAIWAACNPGPKKIKSWGIFKETYKGEGIYWSGRYNIEGQGAYRTIDEARNVIDEWLKSLAETERKEREEKIAAGAIKAVRNGDKVTVFFPEGPATMPMWRYRQNVFEWEEKYGEIVFA